MARPRINSMEELAAAIGVSRPTLSRYFQNSASVRPATARKIESALEQVDYVPNFFATRMNRKSTGLIGVVIPHLTDLFFASLLEEIETAATAAGYTVITQGSHGSPEIEARAIERLISMNADGVLLAPLGARSRIETIERLHRSLPIVQVDSGLPGLAEEVDLVGTDNRQSMTTITEYLLRRGGPVAYLGMPRLNENAAERETVYRQVMEANGQEPVVIRGREVDDSWHFETHAHDVMDAHFSQGRHGRGALLCANDRLAIGALRAALRHGLAGREAGPGGLRIAGHDDHPLSRFMTPSLTTIAQDIRGIATTSVELLSDRIEGRATPGAPRRRLFEATLRLRESA